MIKNKLKKVLIFFLKLMAAACIAVLILSAINMVYSYTGVHIDNLQGTTDFTWESNQLRTNMTEGFAWLRMDNYGFNNTEENAAKAMTEGVDILLMGSSHMEAMQVSEQKNLGALLNARVDEMNTYNIGISGHDIYRIFDNVENAVHVYQPEKILLMETDEIRLEVEKMQEVIDGTAKKIPSYDSGVAYQLQKIPAIKWIYKSLEDWMSQSKSVLGNDSAVLEETSEDESLELYEQVLLQFLDLCSQACQKTGCQPIIFYHQQAEIQEDGTVDFGKPDPYLEIFSKACEEKDIIFVDMNPVFLKEYEDTRKLPHGFSNAYVGSGHINANGHRIIADELITVIREQEENRNGVE